MTTNNTARWAHYCIILITIVLALFYLGNVILPFILSLFLTILLLPVVQFLDKLWFPKWLSALIAVGLFTGIVGGIGFFLYDEINALIRNLPGMISKESAAIYHAEKFMSSPEVAAKVNEYSQDIINFGMGYLQKSVSYISSTLFMIAMIPVYIFFMLMSRDRVDAYLMSRHNENLEKTNTVVSDIKKSIQKYIIGLTSVIIVVSTLLSIGLYFLDIPYWLLLGVLCGLLGLFPYIGVALGALLPLTIAILTKDALWYPIAVLGLFILVQFLEGNVITPNIIGNAVNINPVALMLALLFMGVISGILGLILTIPTLAVVRILMESSDELRPYAKLLAHKE
jgi:predicted PurR-regulated permease PerM